MRLRMGLLVSLLALASLAGAAQRAGGRITGRIVSDDGQPLRGAMVHAIGVGVTGREGQVARQSVAADEEGNFVIENLDFIPYRVTATMPGYVASQPIGADEPRYARVGESLTLMLTRGGVITGRVTNAAGEPVVRIRVRVIPIRDEAGRPHRTPPEFNNISSPTDDRGIYRIYGLPAGSYLVATDGGRDFSIRAMPFAARASTFHPSATRDTAVEVKVARGGEATGIDIRYRGEAGVSISGKVAGVPPRLKAGIQMEGSLITLRDPATGIILDTTYLAGFSSEPESYAFYGVLNGEYEVRASWSGQGGESVLASPARRVTIKGQSVAGLDLALAPLASIAGTIAIDAPLPDGQKCEGGREYAPEEIALFAHRDEPAQKDDSPPSIPGAERPVGVPDEKGAFRIRNLMPGRHRIEASLPDERWYLKAMTMAPPAPDPRNGIAVKAGERVEGLRLTIGAAAAVLQGRVVAAPGARLPNALRVHLLPAEPVAKDDPLRFFETQAGGDGVFSLAHLAPGRYLLLARPAAEPAPRDAGERARLRSAAEAAGISLDLKPCQRVQSQISYRER